MDIKHFVWMIIDSWNYGHTKTRGLRPLVLFIALEESEHYQVMSLIRGYPTWGLPCMENLR